MRIEEVNALGLGIQSSVAGHVLSMRMAKFNEKGEGERGRKRRREGGEEEIKALKMPKLKLGTGKVHEACQLLLYSPHVVLPHSLEPFNCLILIIWLLSQVFLCCYYKTPQTVYFIYNRI